VSESLVPIEITLVVKTLRFAARWVGEDAAQVLRQAAEEAETCRTRYDLIGYGCPVCQEIDCDAGCPLENVRNVLNTIRDVEEP